MSGNFLLVYGMVRCGVGSEMDPDVRHRVVMGEGDASLAGSSCSSSISETVNSALQFGHL